ncbi:sensor histidine kinase [Aestuariimicrobium sp. T2.26MG-19.2B]|uniref:sensor histidine kinase n=1 Tax=Aestuariimicrobium sp. T2.26MG-19.2B TaxID=3040679 RepID=UPI002541906F|nr:HAMP domain-containing sensor histidine kinase [Aestuariimicrobium sp. T2.26MG-19.2B]
MVSMLVVGLVVAVLLVGGAAWASTRWSLYHQLDNELVAMSGQFSAPIQGDLENMGGLSAEALAPTQTSLVLVRADGQVTGLPGAETVLTPGPDELTVARTQHASPAHTQLLQGQRLRVLATPLVIDGQSYALVVAQPLAPTDETLSRLTVVLVLVGAAGVVGLGLLGWALGRSAVKPLRQLANAVARITETDDLRPVQIAQSDDLGNLTESFNTMLNSLASSRERQKRLIADAGHELRTPLTSMRTNVELLIADDKTGMLPPGARAEILHDVAGSLGEFTSLVGDLVQLSRDDRVAISREPIDFAEVVRSAIVRARRRGPGLVFDVELNPLYLLGESDNLERAVTNLLDNAVKFSPPGGTIRVHLEGDRLRISDQGPGIAEEDLPHVFDRFFRSDRARNTPGTGLGLSIVAHTVEAHGGTVRAGHSAEGGAEFTVILPGSQRPLDEP